MTWLLRSVRAQWIAPLMALLGVASALLLGGSFVVPVIDASATFGELPYTVVTPLVGVVVTGYLIAAASPSVASVSVRRHSGVLAMAALVSAGIYVATHCGTLFLTDRTYDLSGARNALGYVAMLLLAQVWLGLRNAPLVPVLYVVLATIFGRVNGVLQPWAWPVLPGHPADLIAAGGVAMVAALVVNAARMEPRTD